MKIRILLLAMLFCITGSSVVFPAQNPFVSGKRNNSQTENTALTKPRWYQAMLAKITAWQRSLRQQLTRFGKDIREQPFGKAFWLFLLCSLAYGAIHAIGPGHGKTIVVSYFLSRPGKYWDGILMANMLTCVHVFSAVTIVLFVHFALTVTGLTTFDTASRYLERLSCGLLILLGLFLLGRCVYDIRQAIVQPLEDLPAAQQSDRRQVMLTAFITGLVPCPGAALILMFTISQQIFAAGLSAMVCMAAGMGATTTLCALGAILSRNALFYITARRQKLFALSHIVLTMSGAVCIISIGCWLLFGEKIL